PLEFSHAAYRVGHAMIRPGYEMNDGVDADARSFLSLSDNLALGSLRMSQELPVIKDWYAQWSKFFETAGRS
ncbi:MAG: peroxidase family protein, partial [Alphaproteobacteria bacterium]